jgi:hypothetical protein
LVKPIPPWLTFRDALKTGHLGRIEDRSYLDWVKSLECCVCNTPADDPHHIVVSGKGMGTKTPDYWAIPLCRQHHDELHHDKNKWEEEHGLQWEHAAVTMLRWWVANRL